MTGQLEIRIATIEDAPQLAEMNYALIEDEGHRDRRSLDQLVERMRNWLAGEYVATLFVVHGRGVGYALYRREDEWTYLRQFFVKDEFRRQGIGRQAIQELLSKQWRDTSRIRLDVLTTNPAAHAFWRSVGFLDYCMTMELER